MSNENKPKMSVVLASTSANDLAKTLNLSSNQLAKAKSKALQLSNDIKLANCDPWSLLRFVFETARYNFERDDSVYPVPYANKVQAQVGYQGWKELAYRTGKYSLIDCIVVKECDQVFINNKGQVEVKFCSDYKKNKESKPIGYFAFAEDKNGKRIATVYLDNEEAVKHGKRYSKTFTSQSATNVWRDNFDAMASKTAIKKLIKKLDITPEIQEAFKLDQIVLGQTKEQDAYLDNPTNTYNIPEEIEAPKQETTIKNRLEAPKKVEQPKKVDAEPVVKKEVEEPKKAEPIKDLMGHNIEETKEEITSNDGFFDMVDEVYHGN